MDGGTPPGRSPRPVHGCGCDRSRRGRRPVPRAAAAGSMVEHPGPRCARGRHGWGSRDRRRHGRSRPRSRRPWCHRALPDPPRDVGNADRAATRSTKSLTRRASASTIPFLTAPAAFWCARMLLPSRKVMPSCTPCACAMANRRSHTPSLPQRMNVCAAIHHDPPDDRLDDPAQVVVLSLAVRAARLDQRRQHRPLLIRQHTRHRPFHPLLMPQIGRKRSGADGAWR